MKTLKIDVPIGHKFDGFDEQTSEVRFKEKLKGRPETVAELLADHGLTQEEFDKKCEGLSVPEYNTRIIELLCKSFNGDWTPNFDNASQYKYEPRFLGGAVGFRFVSVNDWFGSSISGSRLCFEKYDDAEWAGTKFSHVYKKIIVIEKKS